MIQAKKTLAIILRRQQYLTVVHKQENDKQFHAKHQFHAKIKDH